MLFFILILSVLLDIFLILKYDEMHFFSHIYIIKSFSNMFGCQMIVFITYQNVAFVEERFLTGLHTI